MRNENENRVPAEGPVRSRDWRDENPEESRRRWEAFFDACEIAKEFTAIHGRENEDRLTSEEAA